ncbi:hypothetical protein PG988_004714 [Apiospora saccharicola]
MSQTQNQIDNNSIMGTMTYGSSKHGGLMQSIHSTAGNPVVHAAPNSVGSHQQHDQSNVTAKEPIDHSIHGPTYRLTNGRTSATADHAYGGSLNPQASDSYSTAHMPTDGPAGSTQTRQRLILPTNNNQNQQAPNGSVSQVPEPKHEEVKQVDSKPEQTKPKEAKVNFHDQFQSLTQKSAKLEQLGGAYYLEQDDRDDLWDAMDLKTSKFAGFETWVVPFPINFNFGKLALDDCNNSYEYLDSRYIRLVFRTHLDKDGNALVKEMLLSPANPSIDLNDLRLRHALMEGYWKLSRFLARLMPGDMINLAEHLKSELYEEIKQKKQERTN